MKWNVKTSLSEIKEIGIKRNCGKCKDTDTILIILGDSIKAQKSDKKCLISEFISEFDSVDSELNSETHRILPEFFKIR